MSSVSVPPVTSVGRSKRYVKCELPSAKRAWPSNTLPSDCDPSASNSHGDSAEVKGVNELTSPVTWIAPLAAPAPRFDVTTSWTAESPGAVPSGTATRHVTGGGDPLRGGPNAAAA